MIMIRYDISNFDTQAWGLATPVGYALELFRLGPASRVLVIFIYLFIYLFVEMLHMLLCSVGVDTKIVQEDDTAFSENSAQDGLHQTLPLSRRRRRSKVHHQKLKGSKVSLDGRIRDRRGTPSELMVTPSAVVCGEVLGVLEEIEELV